MGFLGGDGSVLDAFGNDKYFARPYRYDFVSKLNVDSAAEHKEEIICVRMLVPYEFALDLDDHEIVAVEFADHAGLPVVVECRELVGQVDGFHGWRVSLR